MGRRRDVSGARTTRMGRAARSVSMAILEARRTSVTRVEREYSFLLISTLNKDQSKKNYASGLNHQLLKTIIVSGALAI